MIIEKKCLRCGKIFKTQNQLNREYCSQKCYRYRGHTEETKKLMKLSNALYRLKCKAKGIESAGKKFQEGHTINNGREPWNKGKKGVQVAWNKGKKNEDIYDKETCERLKKVWQKIGLKSRLVVADRNHRTKIELKVEEILKEINIRYLIHYPMLDIAIVDFYLPDNHIIIEADGDYWHNYPYGTDKDHIKDKEFRNNHYKVLRFWERDINNNIEEVKEKIIKEVQRL